MKFKRILKIMFSIIGVTFLVVLIGITIFINHHPAFGGKATGEVLSRIEQSPYRKGEKFTNIYPTKETFDWDDYQNVFKKLLKGNPRRRPSKSLPSEKVSKENIQQFNDSSTVAIWLGHSAIYLKMNGKNILLDPMLGDYPSPVPFFVKRRFNDVPPIEAADLPEIDVVVLSHDHYDHLDYETIMTIKDRTKEFLVPLGVGAHLLAWGVAGEKIKEFSWYEGVTIDDINFTCTPAQHFSGRNIGDKMQTLWCSWVIKGRHTIFFSGDSGYFPEFKKIGDKYGPFDACFMECGQYNELWKDIHMFPEETARAHRDLRGKTLIPIHWGAFSLGMHDWNDPAKRLTKACIENNILLATPKLGEPIRIGEPQLFSEWWNTNL